MSTEPPPPQPLPERPDLGHLKHQAKDLLRAGTAASLSAAQFAIARRYGFDSWPKLKAHVEALHEAGQLAAAIDADDLARVQALVGRNRALLRAPLGREAGPLVRAATRHGGRQMSDARMAIARWLITQGADVRQGDHAALVRAAYQDDVAMVELLVEHGADLRARDVVTDCCEGLSGKALVRLLELGAPPTMAAAKMLLQTYMRRPEAKHAGLEALVAAGLELPDTAALAVHRGRVDLLERLVARDPALLARPLSEDDVYPSAMGIKPGNGLHGTPLEGGTLLHLAIEYDELAVARWLLAHGAAVDARAGGAAGHTPLFHAVVTMGRKDDEAARLLLDHGADPGLRATVSKQLKYMGDRELERPRTYRDCTPIGYARRWAVGRWVNEPALTVVAAAGGRDEAGESTSA